MVWKRISLLKERIPVPVEELAGVVQGAGAAGSVEEERVVKIWVEEPSLERVLGALAALGVPADAVDAVEDEEERDWETWWRRDLGVVRVAPFVVVPSWEEYEPSGGEIVLHIDPGMAFGTAHHPTTRLCLSALGRLDRAPAAVLDMGSGSGILAIAASLLHSPRTVVAWDTDPLAREECERNAAAHGVSIEVRRPHRTERFDLVLANISPPVLKDMAQELERWVAPGGFLVLSGIPGQEVRGVRQAYTLPLAWEDEEEGWRLLVYTRPLDGG